MQRIGKPVYSKPATAFKVRTILKCREFVIVSGETNESFRIDHHNVPDDAMPGDMCVVSNTHDPRILFIEFLKQDIFDRRFSFEQT